MKSQEQFGHKNNELIEDINLAEGMAYAEKPYRDTTHQRKAEYKARYDYIHSEAYREHLRKIQKEYQKLQEDAMNDIDEKMKEAMSREEAWKRNGEALRKMPFEERRVYLDHFRKEEMHFDEEKIQEIKRRYLRRFQTYLAWNEERFNEFVEESLSSLNKNEFSEEQMRRNNERAEAPLATGFQAAEDFKRTYLRRAKQEHLTKEEALDESSQVRERAREEAEERLEYGKILGDITEVSKRLSWEDMARYNDIRNWLNKPLDEHIKASHYEEALEHVERLKEVPLFNFASWLKAQVELKGLEIKDTLRRKRKPLRPRH